MPSPNKDTIYIDIDDEITGIIDKLKGSSSKVVALVLPKRASVFQSIVNMKLLKKASESSNKNIVLITSEVGLLPLAGAAGIHVAKTITSKPEIPAPPIKITDNVESVQEDLTPEETEALDPTKSLGELAGDEAITSKDGVETVALDNEVPVEKPVDKKAEKPKKDTKDKKLKVPNFNRFRKVLIALGIILVLLIIGFIYANASLAKATISINTNSTNIPTNLNLNLSTAAKSLDSSSTTLPAKLDTQQKTFTQQVGTTGQKNNGNKASGSVTMTAQVCGSIPNGPPNNVPAGTGVSSNGLTYITQSDTSFKDNPGPPKNGCLSFQADNNTTIIAQSGGANYNNTNTFTVSGRSDISVSVASTLSGGTDSIVQTVNQNDINSAKSKIGAANDNAIKIVLQTQLQGEGYYPMNVTYNVGTPVVTSSANVGDVASSVTVTETINYSMFGVHKNDLKTLVNNSVSGQIDTSKQSILDEGLASATYSITNQNATSSQIAMSTTAVAGPQLNIDNIMKNAQGKKAGDIKNQILTSPGVTNVSVKFSPFWRTNAPSNVNNITVKIAKPSNTK